MYRIWLNVMKFVIYNTGLLVRGSLKVQGKAKPNRLSNAYWNFGQPSTRSLPPVDRGTMPRKFPSPSEWGFHAMPINQYTYNRSRLKGGPKVAWAVFLLMTSAWLATVQRLNGNLKGPGRIGLFPDVLIATNRKWPKNGNPGLVAQNVGMTYLLINLVTWLSFGQKWVT